MTFQNANVVNKQNNNNKRINNKQLNIRKIKYRKPCIVEQNLIHFI